MLTQSQQHSCWDPAMRTCKLDFFTSRLDGSTACSVKQGLKLIYYSTGHWDIASTLLNAAYTSWLNNTSMLRHVHAWLDQKCSNASEWLNINIHLWTQSLFTTSSIIYYDYSSSPFFAASLDTRCFCICHSWLARSVSCARRHMPAPNTCLADDCG